MTAAPLVLIQGGSSLPCRPRRVTPRPLNIHFIHEDGPDGRRRIVLALDEARLLVTWVLEPTEAVEVGTALREAGLAAGGVG